MIPNTTEKKNNHKELIKTLSFLLLAIAAAFFYIDLKYPEFFRSFYTHVLSHGYGNIGGAIHTGDQLQLIYLSWMEKMNIIQGKNIFMDRFIFQSPEVAGYRVFEVGPLLLFSGFVSIWMSVEAAWNISFFLIPIGLGIIFNYLLLNMILRNRLMAASASIIPLFVTDRLYMQVNGHQAGAYYFFIPLTLYILESIRRDAKTTSLSSNVLLFICLFGSTLGEIHVGYYCTLLSCIWLLVHFVADLKIKKYGLSHLIFTVRFYFKRYYGFLLSIAASGIFGFLLKHLVLEESGKKIVRGMSEAALYSGDLLPTLKNMNYYYAVSFIVLVIGISVYKSYRKIHIDQSGNSDAVYDVISNNKHIITREEIVTFITYLSITVFFTFAACGAREPLTTYFPIVHVLREILPFFKMQRTYSKMLLPVYLSSIVFMLLPWKIILKTTVARKPVIVFSSALLAIIMHLQVETYFSKQPKFNLFSIEKSPYNSLFDYIQNNTTKDDIILDLPIMGGESGYDGKSFSFALHTERKFIGGYNGAVPSHYKRIYALSRLYGTVTDYESIKLFRDLGLKFIVVDKHAPEFSHRNIENLKRMPWFDLGYEDAHGAFFSANEDLHYMSQDDKYFRNTRSFLLANGSLSSVKVKEFNLRGFHSELESGFSEKSGLWMVKHRANLTVPPSVPYGKARLHIRFGSFISNTLTVKSADQVKRYKILAGINNIDYDFKITEDKTVITLTLDQLVSASKYNPDDERKLGILIQDINITTI